MASKDFKRLLQHHASALFALHSALQSLKFNQDHYPTIRYDRGQQSSFEMYWCGENPPATLNITWLSYTNSPILRSNGASTLPIPASVKVKALALLKELDTNRELVALYRCGHFDDDKFILSCWLIPFPADYKAGDGEGSGTYLTVTCEGVLGLAYPYSDDKKLRATLL